MLTLGLPALRRSAHRWLEALHTEIGAAGLAAAAALPGLAAALDQHAAAVRDTTLALDSAAIAGVGVVLLAEYGRGLLSGASRRHWRPPQPGQWAHADWVALRLTALCALAQQPSAPRPELPSAGDGHPPPV